MATQADSEVDPAELDEDISVIEDDEPEATEGDEPEADPQPEEADGEGDTTDEVVVSIIGDESPTSEEEEFNGQPAPVWVRDLRKKAREDARRIRELEEQVKAAHPADKPVTVGQEPKLEDYDYDTERFTSDWKQWHQRKLIAEAKAAEERKQQEAQEKAWQAKLEGYGKAKAALKVSDFDEAEEATKATLSVPQQGIIVSGSDNPALLVYALGKHPKKAAELAAITDPVRFAFAVAKLETQLKTTPRKTAPLPEKTVRGSAPGGKTGSTEATLARLYEKAAKTGDLTEVRAYQRQLRARGK